ncbi:glycosyl hydrolase family 95 catalytic domain-containing protein [Granulicella arctica]|uniref:Glycosyl hydrolase family 95 catalytic domain-containing protein n=1 Tax=Granulicella arctica TaxID=940613 RepID=A0A7Y9PE80_9BACT|nr:glycoside hydrolase [Granulicella arctica]NYF78075.1 hypothetical protein [Granulicella arctica]
MIRISLQVLCAVLFLTVVGETQTIVTPESTAWHDGGFHIDAKGVVGRSTIVLGQPNMLSSQAMPLGNGRLGVALWSANGLTVQLNRIDTLPNRLSPGQLSIPGLAKLTQAPDYSGKLDLYNGEFVEQGGGMTATAYVQPDADQLIIDVTGADPHHPQTVELSLWPPRNPKASVSGKTGILAESWLDNIDPGASGRRFGSLSALSAEGRNVSVSVKDQHTILLSVLPNPDGDFRVLIAGPHYEGREAVQQIAQQTLAHSDAATHKLWWNRFWQHAGLIKVSSPDGAGDYMQNLRDIYLFTAAAESGTEIPGSQAGIADLFSAVRDTHFWDPAAFWHWNLRMQIAANLGAGLPELNSSYFNLYRENLANIEAWTKQHMAGRPGICVPETMRFNGVGIEFERFPGSTEPTIGLNCDSGKPYYNARTISTGAEISFWAWQQYLQTSDLAFLRLNYPLLRASTRFLLAYEQSGPDGLRHTTPSNSHETQWDVIDPTTDLLARHTLYTETIAAAKLLNEDAALVSTLQAELKVIPELPRTEEEHPKTLLPPSADSQGHDVIAVSYLPTAESHNVENIGLEPVWPYGLIGDDSPETDLARRTYFHRPNPTNQDWSSDPIQAARLGLGTEVSSTLVKLTETYQAYVNGLASWGGNSGEFYSEQSAVVATALQEALVQDFDGVIRIAPAIPPGWDLEGTVFVRGKTKVHVQVKSGVVTTAGIEAGSTQSLTLRNPWPGVFFDITDAATGAKLVRSSSKAEVTFSTLSGHSYIIDKSSQSVHKPRFAVITGESPTRSKKLGSRQIGLDPRHAQ